MVLRVISLKDEIYDGSDLDAIFSKGDKTMSVRPRRPPETVGATVLAFALLVLAPTAIASDRHDDGQREQWVGTWGNALHQPDLGVPGLNNSGFNDQTLRQIVHVSGGGARVRVRLSTFGASGLVIGAASIALSATGASTVPGSDRTLTFGGDPSITIPPGALVVSDPVELEVPDGSDLAVSIFVPENTGPATWHFDGRQTSFISPPGDFTASAVMPVSSTTLARFWLAGVDVTASEHTGVIVAIGESVVDGSQSTVDANARWTDQLARRLLAQPGHRAMGVLNEGLAGNRLLHDSLGPNALARFDRDVLAQTGVTHVIVQAGANDIFTLNPVEEVTVEQVIQGHRQLIRACPCEGTENLRLHSDPRGRVPPAGNAIPGLYAREGGQASGRQCVDPHQRRI